MTVLVTGAAGPIGRFVVKELVEAGEHVVSVDRLAPAKLRQNEIYEKTDVGDSLHWFRLFETHKPTSVVHLGAMIAHSSHHDPIETLRVNVMGTGYLFETARLINQPRIVYATSVGVYGAPKLYADLVDEDSPVAPGMIYGATRAMNEATAAHYLRAYGLTSIGLRPTMAYGPGRYVGALGEINRDQERSARRAGDVEPGLDGRLRPQSNSRHGYCARVRAGCDWPGAAEPDL